MAKKPIKVKAVSGAENEAPKPTILQPGDRFLTTAEAALLLRTSQATLNYWRVLGRGPRFYRQRRNVRYLLSDVTAWGTAECVEPARH